jgi:hypothetical protein
MRLIFDVVFEVVFWAVIGVGVIGVYSALRLWQIRRSR